MPTDKMTMTRTLTGESSSINFLNRDCFPLTYVLLFLHGGVSGWHPDLRSTSGHKITLSQWVTQLLFREPRFRKLGPLVNEFLIDVFSCIEDQRLSFHAHNQDKYRTSMHNASAVARRPQRTLSQPHSVDAIIIPSSFSGGFADQAKKLTEAMTILRHFGRPSYFLTVSFFDAITYFTHVTRSGSNPLTKHNLCRTPALATPALRCPSQDCPEIRQRLHQGQTAYDRAQLCARVFKQKLDTLLKVKSSIYYKVWIDAEF